MPIPAIILGAAGIAALTGIGTGADAIYKNSEAKDITWAAQVLYDRAKEKAEKARGTSYICLEELGRRKMSVLNYSMNRFIKAFDQIRRIELTNSGGLNEIGKFQVGDQAILEMRELGSMAASAASGVVGGVGAGALAAFGAYGATATFATASTGTAIAALSGAAAKSATLAFLGGGTIAAGGGGVALGSTVLGGVIAGPAIAILGIAMNLSASKNLDNAHSNRWKARELAEGLNVVTVLCNGISCRANMFSALLYKLDVIFVDLIGKIECIVKTNGSDYNRYTKQDQNTVAMALSIAGAIKKVLDTPILEEDGRLREESSETRDVIIDYLKNIDSNSCDDLPSEMPQQVDVAGILTQKAKDIFGDKGKSLLEDRRIARNVVSNICRGKVDISDILCLWDMTVWTNGTKGMALTTKGIFCNYDNNLCADYIDIVKTEISYSPAGINIFTADGKRYYVTDIFINPDKLKQFLDCASSLYEVDDIEVWNPDEKYGHAPVKEEPVPQNDMLSMMRNLLKGLAPSEGPLKGAMLSVIDDIVPQAPKNLKTKRMEDIRPIFRNVANNLSVFAQVRLLVDCGCTISTEEVREVELTDADRYLLHQFSFFVGNNDLKIKIVDNIPEGLEGNDLIIAKTIFYKSLTREEKAIYDSLKKEVGDAMYKYNALACEVRSLLDGKEYGGEKWFYAQINEARKTGWFDLPEPNALERKYFPQNK